MRGYVVTTLNRVPRKIYDTEGGAQGAGAIRRLLKPQVIVTDDRDRVLYVWGEAPPDFRAFLLIPGFLLVALVVRAMRK